MGFEDSVRVKEGMHVALQLILDRRPCPISRGEIEA
jgi:hypothetical protein